MDETLKLRDQVCFALYSASRAITGMYRPALERMGLTYPQFLVMVVLWENNGRTVKQIGNALQLDSGTLSPVIKRLESVGLVTRRREAADERKVTVHLTESGTQLREQVQSVPQQVAEAAGLSLDELIALRDTLHKVTQSISTINRKEQA